MKNPIKAVTFNIRCVYNDIDGINCFIHRAGMVFEKILNEMPEVIMFQEMRKEHLNFLERALPEYVFYGHFRDADYTGEGVYTAVLKSRITVLGYDSYWLSPTVYTPGSRFENQSECPRTCLTLKLLDKETGKVFKVANTHLDHISDEARIEGIHVILEKAAAAQTEDRVPYILGGDFNATPDSGVIAYCNNFQNLPLFDVTGEIGGTWHDYGKRDEKIDYIYVTEEIKNHVTAVYRWEEELHGIYLSDHYPVCMEWDIAAE